MNPTGIENLTPEDADAVVELCQIFDITAVKRLAKGSDRKFYIETAGTGKRLLKICETADIYKYETEKDPVIWRNYHNRFERLIGASNVAAQRRVGEGLFRKDTMTYELMTWLDGEDLMDALPRLSPEKQYSVGVKAGRTLLKLHKLPPPWEFADSWEVNFGRQVRDMLRIYSEKPEKTRGEDMLIKYLSDNIGLLKGRHRVFPHGDHSMENIILMPDGEIGFIDFAALGADPWDDFWEVPHDVSERPHFFCGQINGYFDGAPPKAFFPLLKYYIAFGYMEWSPEHAETVAGWFDDMKSPVPSWYRSLEHDHLMPLDSV